MFGLNNKEPSQAKPVRVSKEKVAVMVPQFCGNEAVIRNTMVKYIYSLSIFCFLFPVILFAQQDLWDVYLAQYEKGVGSTLINISAKSYAPNRNFPFVVVTGVTFTGCNSDGMPSKEQFPELYKISDSVKSEIDRIVSNISVATFTYQCERLDYYYVKDTVGLRGQIFQIYSKYFQSYKPYFNIKEDKTWEAYLTFLYPNDETFEFMQNQKVVTKLVESGDKLDKARLVDHWIYFVTEQDRDCYIKYTTKLGFKVEAKEKTKDTLKPFALHISRTDKVDVATISKLTIELRKEAIKCNGDYDGWETFIVK